MNASRLTGALLVVVPLVFTAGFTGLQMVFDYPGILRHPAGELLNRFAAGGSDLQAYWYLMFLAGVMLIPLAIGWAVGNFREYPLEASLAGAFGAVAGLVQAMGLLRWTVLVPSLAAAYTAPGAGDLDKALATSAFDTANAYLGMGVGEHMGYLFTALFTVMVALTIFRRWSIMAWIGAVAAAGMAFGMLEPFGVPMASTINAIAFTGWSVWALVLGVLILWRGQTVGAGQAIAA
jgi:hypothetical protein